MKMVTVSLRDGSTKSVESKYDDQAVVQRLWELTGFEMEAYGAHLEINWSGSLRSKFARDLAVKAETGKLSPKQVAWVHVLVAEAEAPKPAAVPVVSLLAVRQMMDQAAEKLKRPKVLIKLGDQWVRFSRAGDAAKNPGRIHVTDDGDFGDNLYFGYIDGDGNFFRRKASDALVEALVEFNENPSEKATAHGKEFGHCCFCSRELTTQESLSVGYGPVCADRYGLPWGLVG
jgi:hypothetical protein